ncbi:MAG: lysyl oxidase family protein [Acidimicrobiales bacterium]
MLARCALVLSVAVALVAAGCGSADDFTVPALGDPRGNPQLPDLVPAPPVDVHTRLDDETGRWTLRFSSTLANVGDGPFILHARRTGAGWTVEQEVAFSEEGGASHGVGVDMAWGGDGHDHWHIRDVAHYQLLAADDAAQIDEDSLVDGKIGFCFFDSGRAVEGLGDDDPTYHHESCGAEDDREIGMGLSVGWHDEYTFALPGQSIDIHGVPDGVYRLVAVADPDAAFDESDETNNETFVDLELSTTEAGQRVARVIEVGPSPE